MCRQSLAAILQDGHGPLVVPTDEDPFQEVGVATLRERCKKVPSYQLTTVGHALGFERRWRAGDDMWGIEEDPPEAGVGLQDRRQQGPMPSPHVHDGRQS